MFPSKFGISFSSSVPVYLWRTPRLHLRPLLDHPIQACRGPSFLKCNTSYHSYADDDTQAHTSPWERTALLGLLRLNLHDRVIDLGVVFDPVLCFKQTLTLSWWVTPSSYGISPSLKTVLRLVQNAAASVVSNTSNLFPVFNWVWVHVLPTKLFMGGSTLLCRSSLPSTQP